VLFVGGHGSGSGGFFPHKTQRIKNVFDLSRSSSFFFFVKVLGA
jgi:hypothetical protein